MGSGDYYGLGILGALIGYGGWVGVGWVLGTGGFCLGVVGLGWLAGAFGGAGAVNDDEGWAGRAFREGWGGDTTSGWRTTSTPYLVGGWWEGRWVFWGVGGDGEGGGGMRVLGGGPRGGGGWS